MRCRGNQLIRNHDAAHPGISLQLIPVPGEIHPYCFVDTPGPLDGQSIARDNDDNAINIAVIQPPMEILGSDPTLPGRRCSDEQELRFGPLLEEGQTFLLPLP